VLFTYTATSFLILPFDELEQSAKPSFDFAGKITGVVGLVLFNFAWNQAGLVEWQVPYTYILIIMPWGMDMSFPSGTIILSNALPREHQGMAASLVTTTVNYSISLGLGIAGIIMRYTTDGANELEAYRNSSYFAIGFDGLGMAIALYFLWISVMTERTDAASLCKKSRSSTSSLQKITGFHATVPTPAVQPSQTKQLVVRQDR